MTQVLSGIPQGSVLGPILFTIFINDLPDCVQSCCKVFADDTKIYDSTNNAGRKLEYRRTSLGYRDGQICGIYILMLLNVKLDYNYKIKLSEDKYDNIAKCEEKDLGVIFNKYLSFLMLIMIIFKILLRRLTV